MRLTPDALEAHQIGIYFFAVLTGGLLALTAGTMRLEVAINPVLAVMLYATFLQVPAAKLGRALTHGRFLAALLTVNFGLAPLVVATLALFLPDEPLLRLGVLLVLLTPCIDYVVTFTHLGRGDARLLLAATPVLLGLQLLLLPVYVWAFLGADAAELVQAGPFLEAFLWLVIAPLCLAWLTQAWAARRAGGRQVLAAAGWLPVPSTALVLLVVVAAVAPRLGKATGDAAQVVPIYAAYVVIMPLVAWGWARLFRLETAAARALAFSASTRNSLVVLPLAFAIPGGVPLVPAVIVTQTLVELLGELLYIRWLPRLIRSGGGVRSEVKTAHLGRCAAVDEQSVRSAARPPAGRRRAPYRG